MLDNGTHRPPQRFSTFSGALHADHMVTSVVHTTSPEHDGIHVILYHKVEEGSCNVPLNNAMTRISSMHETRNINDTPCTQDLTDLLNQSRESTSSCDQTSSNAQPCVSSIVQSIDTSVQSSITVNQTLTQEGNKTSEKLLGENELLVPTSIDSVNSDNLDSSQDGEENSCSLDDLQDPTFMQGSCNSIFNDVVNLNGKDVNIQNNGSGMYLLCSDIFDALDMQKHIAKEGFKFIDKHLSKFGITKHDAFMFKGKKRNMVTVEAVLALLTDRPFKLTEAQNAVKHEISLILSGKETSSTGETCSTETGEDVHVTSNVTYSQKINSQRPNEDSVNNSSYLTCEPSSHM